MGLLGRIAYATRVHLGGGGGGGGGGEGGGGVDHTSRTCIAAAETNPISNRLLLLRMYIFHGPSKYGRRYI